MRSHPYVFLEAAPEEMLQRRCSRGDAAEEMQQRRCGRGSRKVGRKEGRKEGRTEEGGTGKGKAENHYQMFGNKSQNGNNDTV